MRLYLSSFRLGSRPDRLLELLGGATRAVVIANADDYKTAPDRVLGVERELVDLRGLGLDPVEVDLRQYFDDPAAVRPLLENADLVWVRGGNPFLLRRALARTGADQVLLDLIAADRIVYAGYSAGACLMTPSLRGIEVVDDVDAPAEGYPDEPTIWECLNLVPYSILPHYRSDHPESHMIDKALEYMVAHHIPFIAIHDGQAIVIDGDTQEIVG